MLIPVKLTFNNQELKIGELVILKYLENSFYVVNYANILIGEISHNKSNDKLLENIENKKFSIWGIFKKSIIIEMIS